MLKFIKKRNYKLLMLFVVLFTFGVTNVNALYNPDSFYDAISWKYSYQATYTNSYNCLGWATGSMTWEWPSAWGEGANLTVVNLYFKSKGYLERTTPSLSATKIVGYGPSSNKIVHFSKVSLSKVSAKWGRLERFSHYSELDPYYSNSVYGLARVYYI